MAQDAEAAMIGFYLLRGHSLEELLSLSHADKLFYIAEYEGRTGSGQILYLIRRCITEFEQVHGKINLEEDLRD